MTVIDMRIWMTGGYLFGTALHLLMRSDLAYKSKVNPFPTRRAWFSFYWVSILVRTCFWGYGLWWLWILHPDWPAKVAITFWVPPDLANWIDVTPTLGSSVGFGFFADVGLDYSQIFVGAMTKKFPSLAPLAALIQAQVPQYNPDVVDTSKTDGKQEEKKEEEVKK